MHAIHIISTFSMHSDSCVRTLLLVWELVCLAVSEMSSQNEQQQQHPADHSSNTVQKQRVTSPFSLTLMCIIAFGGGGGGGRGKSTSDWPVVGICHFGVEKGTQKSQ